jgi:hypothetical protein
MYLLMNLGFEELDALDKVAENAQIICTKVRDGNNRIVKLKEGDPTGRHVVIVDDLVQSGGTLIECQVRQLFLYSIPIIIYMIWSLTSPF